MSRLEDRLLAVHDGLTAAAIPHAIGGAIALGYCVLEARATQDVDINVFVTPDRTKEVFSALPREVVFSGLDVERAERDGQVRLWWEITPIDLFFNVLPIHEDVEKNVRHVPLGGRTIPVLSCTGLTVFKAMFDRPRDWVDIEAMVEARAIDLDEAIEWVSEMAGADSVNARRLEELGSGTPPGGG
ncbi:MAG TPA: hypothetical protein VGY30_01490 [Solirubrobacteraceae bacterium]|nr:hypothetical protein [Solirubrobacteraceae bacterium]